jgi:hypothetical protein
LGCGLRFDALLSGQRDAGPQATEVPEKPLALFDCFAIMLAVLRIMFAFTIAVARPHTGFNSRMFPMSRNSLF